VNTPARPLSSVPLAAHLPLAAALSDLHRENP